MKSAYSTSFSRRRSNRAFPFSCNQRGSHRTYGSYTSYETLSRLPGRGEQEEPAHSPKNLQELGKKHEQINDYFSHAAPTLDDAAWFSFERAQACAVSCFSAM